MSKKSIPTAPPDAKLSPDQIRQGIERLKRRVADVEGFEPERVQERWAPETKTIETAIEETLARVFGHDTPAYRRYQPAADLDRGGLVIGGGPDPLHKVHQWLRDGRANSLALLTQAIRGLEEDLAEAEPVDLSHSPTPKEVVLSNDVFVVHGRDELAKEQAAGVLRRAGLNAVVLHEQPHGGKTIIEKFEQYGSASGFAVVVATPDDVGGLSGGEQKPRARQNVIGEMFWFAGRLGRDRVAVLVRGDVDMPSDIAGVGYIPMDDHGGWKSKLLQELSAAGYKELNWPAALA